MIAKLSQAEIRDRLQRAAGWRLSGGQIERTFEFPDFDVAIDFVRRIAQVAQGTQHHPDILIKYTRVTLSYSTHDAGGVTDKDFAGAAAADTIASGHSATSA